MAGLPIGCLLASCLISSLAFAIATYRARISSALSILSSSSSGVIFVGTVSFTSVVLVDVGCYYEVFISICLLVDGISLFNYVLLVLIMSVS